MRSKLTALAAGLVVAFSGATLVAPQVASAGEGGFCVEVLIGAGNTCQHGTYHGAISSVDGRSTGEAFSAVWVANSNRDRISQRGDCVQPGCTAQIGGGNPGTACLLGATCWAGFVAVHNPMSYTSRFRGYLRFY